MPINFDRLPKDKPEGGFALPKPGFHGVTIESTEVKTAKSGNEYLNLKLKLDSGEIMFDMVMDHESAALQYKLGRFVTACKLPLTGELTLADLGTVVKGKRLVADIKIEEQEYNGEKKPKAVVDIFTNDIFYPIEELGSLTGNEDVPFTEGPTTPPTGSY